MAYTTLASLMKAIADAIRSKDGTTGKINTQNIPSRILSIPTGGSQEYHFDTLFSFSQKYPSGTSADTYIEEVILPSGYSNGTVIVDVDGYCNNMKVVMCDEEIIPEGDVEWIRTEVPFTIIKPSDSGVDYLYICKDTKDTTGLPSGVDRVRLEIPYSGKSYINIKVYFYYCI